MLGVEGGGGGVVLEVLEIEGRMKMDVKIERKEEKKKKKKKQK